MAGEYDAHGLKMGLLEWCGGIQILKHIQVEKLAATFSDGVLFYHLLQTLLPGMAGDLEELKLCMTHTISPTDYFGKLDNWRLINNMILAKLGIKRGAWFLTFLAKGTDGYIADLLDELRNICGSFQSTSAMAERSVRQSATGQLVIESTTSWNQQPRVTVEVEDGEVEDYSRLDSDNSYLELPALSYYHTPLSSQEVNADDEQNGHYYQHRSFGRQRQRRHQHDRDRYHQRYYSHDRYDERYDSYRYHERYYSYDRQPRRSHRDGLGFITRREGDGFIGKRHTSTWSGYNSSQKLPSFPGARNNPQRFLKMRERRISYVKRVTISESPQNETMRHERGQNPRYGNDGQHGRQRQYRDLDRPEQDSTPRYQTEYLRNDPLNRRFQELQDSANLQLNQQEMTGYQKYFYRYYVQFLAPCNDCFDKNRRCICPRYPTSDQFY